MEYILSKRQAKIIDILKILNIDKEEVSILLLNGMDGGFDRKLKDGDILSIFPPVGGGWWIKDMKEI